MFRNLVPTARYVWLTVEHKWFVFRAGLVVGVPKWQLIVHDLSKFSTAEAPHYGRQFFGDRSDPDGFNQAWLHHQNVNPHHWEYWIPRTAHDRSGRASPGEPMEMPERYAREMVADWMGASRAYEGDYPVSQSGWWWLGAHWDKIRLHPDTRRLVQKILDEALPR